MLRNYYHTTKKNPNFEERKGLVENTGANDQIVKVKKLSFLLNNPNKAFFFNFEKLTTLIRF